MSDNFLWSKKVDYRGMTFTLKKREDGSYEFYLDANTSGLGFWYEKSARKAAEKAIDERLEHERAKA